MAEQRSPVDAVVLTMDDLRQVAAYAAEAAASVLAIFEAAHPADLRPRHAVDSASAFARGGRRGKALRDAAWAALRAARETNDAAAAEAALAAMSAASAAYLHPLARATQVRHVLGAAAHAARAVALAEGDVPGAGADRLAHAARCASPNVIAILNRYPPAPPGGGRVGELLRSLDRMLRRAPS